MDSLESSVWKYWPQVPWEEDGILFDRYQVYQDEYAEIWDRYEVEQDGDNVSRDEINDDLDTYYPEGERVPEGYLKADDPFLLWMDGAIGGGTVVGVDDPEPAGATRILARVLGYRAWQEFRLRAAMQADKLTQFGRRGRPIG